ncbi:MAG: GNAT family N-acetyltransferase [Candidatus Sungbacteria bacterium]|nr:GNAT family N-acetyltransferase [Candidatus Sungbacteria bacterium]
MIRIELLKTGNINEYSRLARRIIQGTPYYSEAAKKNEMSSFALPLLEERLKKKENVLLVAKEKTAMAGFCCGYIDGKVFWLDWIGVDGKFRGRGAAAQLIEFLEAFLRKRNVHKVWCDTRINNKESIALIKKFGYRKIAFLKNHWSGLDYFLWEKFL